MSKQLLLMRHAKSSWDNHHGSDHDRPLNERGQRDVPRMAQFLNGQNLVPDLVLCSSANRALTTANLLIANLNRAAVELQIVSDFYHAPPEVYAEFCRRLADQFERPILIGHNPGMEELVNLFANSGQPMPTAAIAVLNLDIDAWTEFHLGNSIGKLRAVYRPKDIS